MSHKIETIFTMVAVKQNGLTRKLLQLKVAENNENHRMSSPYQDLIFGVFKTGQISC